MVGKWVHMVVVARHLQIKSRDVVIILFLFFLSSSDREGWLVVGGKVGRSVLDDKMVPLHLRQRGILIGHLNKVISQHLMQRRSSF